MANLENIDHTDDIYKLAIWYDMELQTLEICCVSEFSECHQNVAVTDSSHVLMNCGTAMQNVTAAVITWKYIPHGQSSELTISNGREVDHRFDRFRIQWLQLELQSRVERSSHDRCWIVQMFNNPTGEERWNQDVDWTHRVWWVANTSCILIRWATLTIFKCHASFLKRPLNSHYRVLFYMWNLMQDKNCTNGKRILQLLLNLSMIIIIVNNMFNVLFLDKFQCMNIE